MRECAVRGLDGPGLYALDVHPQTWAHLPGYEEALARRAAHLETLKVRVLLGQAGQLGCRFLAPLTCGRHFLFSSPELRGASFRSHTQSVCGRCTHSCMPKARQQGPDCLKACMWCPLHTIMRFLLSGGRDAARACCPA